MSIELEKVNGFIVKIENDECDVHLVRSQKGGELVFEAMNNQQVPKSAFNKKCEITFLWGDTIFFMTGRAYCFPPHRIVVIKQREIAPDRRGEVRLQTETASGIVREKGVFRERRLEFQVVDISRKGIRLIGKGRLQAYETYFLEGLLDKASFHVHVLIKYVNERDTVFVNGAVFQDPGPKAEEVLEFYIQNLENMNPGRTMLRKAHLDPLWKTLERTPDEESSSS